MTSATRARTGAEHALAHGGDRGTKQHRIVDAATSILVREGLAGWTVERVAREAGCAKGLVHYHFTTKWQLLSLVAAALRRERIARRMTAFGEVGTDALDALWSVMGEEVASGECAAWLGLATVRDAGVRASMPVTADELRGFAVELSQALAVPQPAAPTLRAVLATLDAMQLPLLLGERPEAVRDVYDRFWLSVLT